jgi:hypothetical protein
MSSDLSCILKNVFGDTIKYEDFNYELNNINSTEYVILPNIFIKIVSKYIDNFISNNVIYKIIRFIRCKFDITVKCNLSKYQITRIYLEILFNKKKTIELDNIFEQLNVYGNFIINMNSKYDEIINFIEQCIAKSNYQVELSIKDLNDKITRIRSREQNIETLSEYTNEQISVLKGKIANLKSQIKSFDKSVIENFIYDKFSHTLSKFPQSNKDIIIEKVNNYLNEINNKDQHLFKSIIDYQKINNEDSLGKKYENDIYLSLKPILNENGFEILLNTEFEFLSTYSGIKLEYDYIIGKIIDNTFVIYGIFDAKISLSLIKSDIDKFSQGINYLNEDKLVLRDVFKRQYHKQFQNIKVINTGNERDISDDNKLIMGYICKTSINKEKESHKIISKHIIENTSKIFDSINGTRIDYSSLISDVEFNFQKNYQNLVTIFDKYKTQIYIDTNLD